jgi:heme-degrading monooxygenase HmoA
MHARVRTFQVHPGRLEERIRHDAETVLPALRQLKGFKGLLLLADHRAQKTVAIVLWETEADMLASERSEEYDRVLPHHRFAAGEVSIEHFEVALQDGMGS